MIPLPPWLSIRLVASVAAILIAFGGGFKVASWRCDSKIAAIERAADKARARQQTNVETQATRYEQERDNANETTTIREREIRTKYVPVAGTCEPGPDVTGVLDAALEDANGRASGQPVAAMPAPASEADPVH